MVLAVVSVFLAGLTVSGSLFAYRSPPALQAASRDGTMALAFFLNRTPVATR